MGSLLDFILRRGQFAKKKIDAEGVDSTLPTIVSAAVMYPDLFNNGKDLVVMCVRHYDGIANDILDLLDKSYNRVIDKADVSKNARKRPVQGFVATDGKFYTRKQAHAIILRNGQPFIDDARFRAGDCYSENLYR